MLEKISVALVLIMVCSSVLSTPQIAVAQSSGEVTQAEKMKQQVEALKEGARVSIKLRDAKKITGHINYVGEDFFTVTEIKTQASHKLAYIDVVEIERKSKGFPTWGKVVLGVVGVLFVVGMIANGGE